MVSHRKMSNPRCSGTKRGHKNIALILAQLHAIDFHDAARTAHTLIYDQMYSRTHSINHSNYSKACQIWQLHFFFWRMHRTMASRDHSESSRFWSDMYYF